MKPSILTGQEIALRQQEALRSHGVHCKAFHGIGSEQRIPVKPASFQRVVAGDRITGYPLAQHRYQHVVMGDRSISREFNRINGGKHFNCSRDNAGFLVQLAHSRLIEAFPEFNLSTGETPKSGVRRIGPAYQNNFVATHNDRYRSRNRPPWVTFRSLFWQVHVCPLIYAGKYVARDRTVVGQWYFDHSRNMVDSPAKP